MKTIQIFALVVICCGLILAFLIKRAGRHFTIPVTTSQPENNKVYAIAIIGAGAAGTMAAKRAVLNNDTVLLFAGDEPERRRSRGTWVRTVDNIPGLEKYDRAVLQLRNDGLEELVHSPFRNNLFIIENSVIQIEKENAVFKLKDNQSNIYFVRNVILATGMMDVQPQIQGSIQPVLPFANEQYVAYCLTCDGHRSVNKKVAIIGHTDAAAKGAMLLVDRYSPSEVSILLNGSAPAFSVEVQKQMEEKGILVVPHSITQIMGNGWKFWQLTGFKFQDGGMLKADFAFVMLGVRPNNQLALQLGAKVDEKGLVLTDANGESSVPDLFVAGDLRANAAKQIYTAWQHGVESAQAINRRQSAKLSS